MNGFLYIYIYKHIYKYNNYNIVNKAGIGVVVTSSQVTKFITIYFQDFENQLFGMTSKGWQRYLLMSNQTWISLYTRTHLHIVHRSYTHTLAAQTTHTHTHTSVLAITDIHTLRHAIWLLTSLLVCRKLLLHCLCK